MIGQFEYKGTHSSEYGVYFKSTKRPLMPSMKPKMLSMPGASGSYDFGNNEYDNTAIGIRLVYIPKSIVERKQRAREIAGWLSSKKWEKLILGDEPDKYYLARVNGEVDLDVLMSSGEANISFICQPFAYMVADTSADDTWEQADYPWITAIPWDNAGAYTFETKVNKIFTFENVGTRETNFRSPQGSKFNIQVKGSFTTLKLSLNGKALSYNQAVVSKTLTVDCVEMEVTLDGVNKLGVVTGDLGTFLEVVPGNNALTVSGTGMDIKVTIDFSPMWI